MTKPKRILAKIFERFTPKPGHNMLAAEVIKKLDAAGCVIAPKEPTRAMLDAAYDAQSIVPETLGRP